MLRLGAREHREVSAVESMGSDNLSTAVDPVCGMEVETEGAQVIVEHDGTTYYFCGRGCKLDFEEDPERYLDPSYEPTM